MLSSLLQVHSHSHSWSHVEFVYDGVTLQPEANLLDRPGFAALVSAHGLTLDLSGLALIHNAAFRARLEEVKALVRELDV